MRCWTGPCKRTGAPLVEARLLNGLNCLKIRRKECVSRWIIAGLCYRVGMRWAGLSRRNRTLGSGSGVQPDRFSQLRLTLVKGPKAIFLEFQRTRNMKCV